MTKVLGLVASIKRLFFVASEERCKETHEGL